MIEREHAIEFKGVKIIVKFPNVGQLIDIEAAKQALTNNKYGSMASSGVKSMIYALDIVDAIVFVQIMCPQIKALMNTTEYTSMSPEDTEELVMVYKTQIMPWYQKVLDQLYSSSNGKAKGTEPDNSVA